jgi:hypothetical protein
MRPSRQSLANVIAWFGVFALIGIGLGVVKALGFPGVLILGLLTTLICVRAELSEAVPTWPVSRMAERASRALSPEERAAQGEARDAAVSLLRYYRNCGIFLVFAGLLGTIWQFWM